MGTQRRTTGSRLRGMRSPPAGREPQGAGNEVDRPEVTRHIWKSRFAGPGGRLKRRVEYRSSDTG